MKIAEVVKATDQIHACDQGLWMLRQMARAACQCANALAEGGVETFDECGIDPTLPLGYLDEAFHSGLRTLHNTPFDMEHSFESS